MFSPLLPEVVPEIDANPASFTRDWRGNRSRVGQDLQHDSPVGLPQVIE